MKRKQKSPLHSILTLHYPNYRDFFAKLTCKTSLTFFLKYPSPGTLRGTTVEELAAFIELASNNHLGMPKAQQILANLHETAVPDQAVRDIVVQSTIRQILFNMKEIEQLDDATTAYMRHFDCTLTSMTGIDTVTAARIVSCIGDIKNFSSPAKLARYAGIAPVAQSSGKTDRKFANQYGNRELNSIFFWLAVRVCMYSGANKKVLNSFFRDYFVRKMSEGKTKRQAIKCVERRLVNIIWTMLTYNEEYVNPPTYDLPTDQEDDTIAADV